MVGTIASVGYRAERFRHSELFLAATTASGLLAGALTASVLAVAPEFGGVFEWTVLIIAIATVTAAEIHLIRIPGTSRQVDPGLWHWLGHGRASVVWGLQLGTGLSTRIVAPGFYLLFLLPFVAGQPLAAICGYAAFGVGRGLQPLLMIGIGGANDLLAEFERVPSVVGLVAIGIVTTAAMLQLTR